MRFIFRIWGGGFMPAILGALMKKQYKKQYSPLIFLDMGWKISLSLVLLVIVGSYLDSKFHTKPLFILIGIFLSLFTTSLIIYLNVKPFTKEDSE
jgi:hypothetical protein